MFAIALMILVITALLSVYSNLAMRIRLTKAEPSRDKLVWWRRGSGEVTGMYRELFPRSYLPFISQFAFWFLLIFATIVLIASRWKSN
jgi:hypothetical protein